MLSLNEYMALLMQNRLAKKTRARAHTHTHTHAHACTHARTHTHTNTRTVVGNSRLTSRASCMPDVSENSVTFASSCSIDMHACVCMYRYAGMSE